MTGLPPNENPRFALLCQFRDVLARLVAANEELANASEAFNALGLADEPLQVAQYREVAKGHRANLANVDRMIAEYRAGSN